MVDTNFNSVEGKTVAYFSIFCINFLFEWRVIQYTAQEPNLVPTLSEVRVEVEKVVILVTWRTVWVFAYSSETIYAKVWVINLLKPMSKFFVLERDIFVPSLTQV